MERIPILLKILGFLWALPNTIIGFVIGISGLLIDRITKRHKAKIRFAGGICLFERSPAIVQNSALSLGFAHIYAREADEILNGCPCKTHEDQHTIQAMVLGPFFLPIYVLCGLIALCRGGSPIGIKNPLETGPYSLPPRPWWFD